MLITTRINDIQQKAFIDSGCVWNLMSFKCAKKLGLIDQLKTSRIKKLQAINKMFIKSLGQVETTFENIQIVFLVVGDIDLPVILGHRFLRRTRAKIDYGKRTIELGKKIFIFS